MGCGVSNLGIQNLLDFAITIFVFKIDIASTKSGPNFRKYINLKLCSKKNINKSCSPNSRSQN